MMRILFLLVSCFIFSVLSRTKMYVPDNVEVDLGHHKCVHDEIIPAEILARRNNLRYPLRQHVEYENHPMDRYFNIEGKEMSRKEIPFADFLGNSRRSTASQQMCHSEGFGPLRVAFATQFQREGELGGGATQTVLEQPKREYLENIVLPSAKQKIAEILSVIQIPDTFYAARPGTPCQTQWPNGNCQTTPFAAPFGEATVISDYMVPLNVCTITQTTGCTEEGTGFPYTDVVIIVTAENVQSCVTPGSQTLAYAQTLVRDSNGRPLIGHANFCPNRILPDVDYFQTINDVTVTIHEVFHALGYSQQSFGFFRHHSGAPRSVVTQSFPNERGMTVTKIVTETAVAVARKHFNCSTLNGVEIEDGGGGGTAGSHPEMRVYQTDFMTGVLNPNSVFSDVTLAVMQDSGWYMANFANADYLLWGRHRGCDFAMEKCFALPGPQIIRPANTFCTIPMQIRCTNDRRSIGICTLGTFGVPLPTQFQYFPDTTMGGTLDTNDYCPLFNQYQVSGTTRTSNCKNVFNLDPYIENQFFGEEYGPNSLCFENNLRNSYLVGLYETIVGKCYRYSCVGKDSVKIYLAGGFAGYPAEITCNREDEGIGKEAGGPWVGVLICPPIDEVCHDPEERYINTDSCPNQCSGHGTCKSPCTCICDYGWGSHDCSIHSCFGIPIDSESVCGGNGNCTASNVCNCNPGWNVASDCTITKCFGVNSNDASVCSGNGVCEWEDHCVCYGNYFGQYCNVTNDGCSPGKYGFSTGCGDLICYGRVEGVDDNVCNGGICEDNGGNNNTCDCTATPLKGKDCYGSYCFTDWGSIGCSGHGKCIGTDICKCDEGYFGHDCSQFTCYGIAPGEPGECNNNGTCISYNNCDCPGVWKGENCMNNNCYSRDGDDPLVCGGHGKCIDNDLCSCDTGYTEMACTMWSCYGVDSMDATACGVHGNCIDYNVCNCTYPYEGYQCEGIACLEVCDGLCDFTTGLCSDAAKLGKISVILFVIILLFFL